MAPNTEPRIDAQTGTATTGHEWDGICELNTPLPRWWLITWYICILWAVVYWILYPSWPGITGYSQGLLGWHSRSDIVKQMDALQQQRAPEMAKLAAAPLADIEKNPELEGIANAAGGAAFANNCAPCHGAGGQGSPGYPNLDDDDWLWGGTLDQIQQTITHGVRWPSDPDTHQGVMPSFGKDGTLKPAEISAVADYVLSLSNSPVEPGADLAAGKKIFAENCSPCHGDQGKGNQDMGAPNLTDHIWLYAGTKTAIENRVINGGGGVMPAWGQRLDPTTIKALTIYVHGLSGGK